MSDTSVTTRRPLADRTLPGPQERGRATFLHSLHAEWIKLRTMRSTLWVALGTLVAGVGLAALNGASAGGEHATLAPADQAVFDPLGTALKGYMLAQVTLALLGGLVITAEYGSRTIVPTLTAVPHRSRVLAAKGAVLAVAAYAVGVATMLAGFAAGQSALAGAGAPHVQLSDPESLRAVFGGALYLTLAALLGLAVGTLVRSTTATVTTMFATLLIVPAFGPALPGPLADWAAVYWPPTAGGQIVTGYRDPALLDPWPGLGVLALCVAVLLTAAFLTFRRRDA
ncbi:ABC transporter permease [Streptomyces indicus]|uniref:ABC-type transport system involved in multi-copper enzyme maturation, permease component n=1 Tax=Streptomyces indicus TaxID=417292 RepID=A0A1G8ZJG6_9ACTN|nr:ABC transporter permease [Streptomyces indicus]SDK15226.1 ABC-type transport system involved in multi-copper enzyme maturation, permease component [Streptomyces indicus]